MDWLNVLIPVLTALIPAGGLTGFFLSKGKKKELEINNLKEVLEIVKEERAEKKAELDDMWGDLRKKEDYIELLQKEKSELHNKLDKANSRVTALSLLRCKVIQCPDRKPPFGSDATDTLKKITTGKLGEE